MSGYNIGAVSALITDREPTTYEIVGAICTEALDDSETGLDFSGVLAVNDVIRIDDEQMLVTALTAGSTPATVTRGYNNTTAATHLINEPIAKRFPSDPDVMLCNIKGGSANTGLIYLGGADVQIADGTQQAGSGYEIEASQETLYFPVNNLNLLWSIRAVNTDRLSVFVLRTPDPAN